MGLKILHSADWHLGSPFAGFDDSQRALLKQEQQSIPGKISQLCRREKCDLMLLAGDIFDGEPARETVEALKKALSECCARVFITPGNHDFCAPGSLWLEENWPENVYVFTGGLEAVTIPDLNCRVYGAGYQSMDSAPCWKISGRRAAKNTASPCSTAIPPGRTPPTAPSPPSRCGTRGCNIWRWDISIKRARFTPVGRCAHGRAAPWGAAGTKPAKRACAS